MTKECKTCKLNKPIGLFQKRKLSSDGYDLHCKTCKSEYNKKYRKENRTPEKAKLENIKWSRNKDTRKNWDILNKEKIKLQRKSIIENYSKEEYKEFREKTNKWRREKRNNDVLYKLKSNISCRLSKALKQIKENKGLVKTIDTLGCDLTYLKNYIESRFEPWMTWDNYGRYNGDFNYGWDLDHIIPVSIGVTKEEIIELNHYTNLQPLCSKINRDIKKDKLNKDEDKRL